MTFDKNLVETKMADMQAYLAELEPTLALGTREIVHDNFKLHTVERLFQLIVDCAIDINTHIIASSNLPAPDDYQSTFTTIGERGMLPDNFARRIAPSVGLRNLVVHRYGKVDIVRMVDDISHEIGQYRDYLRHIVEYLKKSD
ncbi:DUF86 domain-containing protein [Candidatus Kaiserbacteria bacterium]|nr:DUF86 domain-containing protein [Candidatus Kaiserbacteria bacterium]